MYGFKLIKEDEIKEVNSKSYYYEHESGARLVFLKNKDKNKVFSIGFRTMPENSTGVAHIVEHCVLSGSRKYKTKEPFMDLLKGSLQTFLNAMTYQDKTLYPLSSRNEKDFRNLIDVYLDSVFYPEMLEDERIFMQEGWRYEIHDKDEPLKIQGIVYNEMRGAMSSPEDVLDEARLKAVFPGTFYAENSGGDPYVIPELSYEEFKAFHKKFYHPSNSYIYLYGDIDIEWYLEYLDREYLGNFKREAVPKMDKMPDIKEPVYSREPYNMNEGDDTEKKNYYSYSATFGNASSIEDYIMLTLMDEVLTDSDAGIIKNAILEKNLCEDVYSDSASTSKYVWGIAVKNAEEGKMEEIKTLIEDTLKTAIKEGIDRKLLEASLNKLEFEVKEGGGDFPAKGILYFISIMHHWIFDNDPVFILKTEDTINSLREKINNGYFEEYLKKNILDNPYKAFVEIYPVAGLSAKKDKEIEKKLSEIKNSLTEEELSEIIKKADALKEMQETPDTKEALQTIPKLSLSDVSETDGTNECEVRDGELPFIYRNAFTSGISYFRIACEVSDFTKEELQYLSLLTSLIGSLDTEHYTYQELSNEIYLVLGDIYFGVGVYEHDKTDKTSIKFEFAGKALRRNLDRISGIFEEILYRTKWDSKRRIKELLQMIKVRYESSLIYSGNRYAKMRALSYISERGIIDEILSGIDFFLFVKNLNENFDSEYENLVEKLKNINKKILRKREVFGMITAEEEDYNKLSLILHDFVNEFSDEEIGEVKEFAPEKKNEAFIINSQVQFVSKVANYKQSGGEYSGIDSLITNFLSLDYLHNNVRAMGGAYGVGIATDSKNFFVSSYRDPHIERTIKVYDGMGEVLKNSDLSQEELETAIIGTMNARNPLMTERIKGEQAFSRYLKGITNEDIIKTNREVLKADNAGIRANAEVYSRGMAENNLCVVGSKEKIEAEKHLFDNIISLTDGE